MRRPPRPSTRLAGALAALLCAAAPALAQDVVDLEKLRIPHEKFVLGNGLTVLVHEDHSVPIVAVNLWYHVGSQNEQRGRTGFAHLFEHFFFNGSENYPHGFREAMDDVGATNRNGTTSSDRTNFFENVPVAALERTLYLEADRMGFLAGNLSAAMLERERGVVQNEKRQGENAPYGRVGTRVVETMYPASHPYSWSVIGSMEDLDAATLADIEAWYRQYYAPSNVVLSLAGDITPARARELVEKYFGSIPPGPPLRRYDAWVPRLDANIREVMEDQVAQRRVYRVYHAPPWGEADLVHLQLLGAIVSGSKNSLLDRALVYEQEVATAVSAGTIAREIASQFVVTVTLKAGVDSLAAEREVDRVLRRLIDQGPTAEELDRARTRLLADFARSLETLGGLGGRSDILAESETFGGDSNYYLENLKVAAGATPQAVRDAARRWLDANHYTLTVVPARRLAPATTQLDRKVLPPLAEAPELRFPAIQRARLDNGMEVILLERHSAPLVNATLAVDAGYASDPAGKTGAASLAVDLLDDGTTTRDAFATEAALGALGAQLATGSSVDLSFIRLRALRGGFARSLDILADVALNPVFPEEMVALERRRQVARIAAELADPTQSALRVVPTLIYDAAHAYAKPLTGSGYAETVGSLSRADLAGWHRTWFRPGSATLIVTGDITMAELLPEVRRAFGGWQGGRAPEKNIAPTTTQNVGRIYLMDRPGAQQSVVVATHLARPGGQPTDLALEMVMRNFGGISTSRLNRNLRLDKHWSYGVQGAIQRARGQRPFLVVAPVQTDRTRESMLEVRQEILGVAGARPVQGEEFESIKRNMTLGLPGRFETLQSLESAAIELITLRYPESYFAEYAANLRRLAEPDLAAAAREAIQPNQLVWLVIGDLAVVEPAIRQLGWGEVVRLDAEGRPVGGN